MRPSAGVCVGGTLVVHRVGGGGRGMKARVGVLGFGPWAGLVPIRPEAPTRFVCTGRKSQRRREAAMEGVSAAVLHSLSHLPTPSCPRPPLLCIPLFHLWNKDPSGSSKQFTDVGCLCACGEFLSELCCAASAAVGRTRASACFILPN